MTFAEMLDDLEMAVETALCNEWMADTDPSGRSSLIFERLAGVQNAIDDWRQG